MMDLITAQELARRVVLNTYGERSLLLQRGEGCRVWDSAGREYLDLLSGIAVTGIGHAHPALTRAISKQAKELLHTSNLYYIEPQLRLAEKLSNLTVGGRCFFCNSGAEANEAAIKLARKFGKERSGAPFEIIVAQGSFHGRTLATIAATAQEKYQKPFRPMPAGFRFIPFNDIQALKAAVTPATIAILLEPLQGEGGVRPASLDFLKTARQIANDQELLLIFDEVQTGMGRTGNWFAWQGYGVKPDLFSLAKGLGGGFPIGALVVLREGLDFAPGDHASTFGGNHLACTAALTVINTIEQEELLKQVQQRGIELSDGLKQLKQTFPDVIKHVRGAGLLQGIELTFPGAELVKAAQDQGILINCTAGNVLRFAPAFVITSEQIQQLLRILNDLLQSHQEK